MRRWWEALRHSDPHIQLLVAILALPLSIAVLGALVLLARALLGVAGVF